MSNSKIERLKAIRAAHRGVCTKLEKETYDLLSQDLNDETTNRLEVIGSLLEAKQKTLSDIDTEITALCELTEISKEIEDSEAIVARIITCRKKIKDAKPVVNNEQQSPVYVQTNSTQDNVVKPRLPKLTLPKFKGDVTKWTTFWDSFNSAIHSNDKIPAIDKFNYLNAHLEGTAARAIQGLTLTSGNYTSAVELLKERFGKPQIIISAHIDEILKIQASTDGRLSSLRYVYDKISVNVRGLASLGVSSDQYGSILIPIVMSKLPSDVRLQIARKNTSEIWKIDELLDVIKTEIEARESSEGAKTSVVDNRKNPYNSKNQAPIGGSALLSQTQGEFKIRCAYCDKLHYSASCDVVKSSEDRKRILSTSGRCYNCLRKGHQAKNCSSERNCRHCKKRHHQSICDTLRETKNEEKAASQPKNDDPTKVTTATSYGGESKRNCVLLQTARAMALDETGECSVPVRILLDTGSQQSYVTENLCSKLRLKPVKREKLSLNTFGENRYKTQKCDRVNLKLQKPGNSETVEISALKFPVICSALPSKVNIQDYPHLQDLEFAENFDNDGHDTIDVLIGSDHYWDIITSEGIRADTGPTAINSKFGWVLSGPISDSSSSGDNVASYLCISGAPRSIESNDEIVSVLRRFWETDSIGIKNDQDVPEEKSIESEIVKPVFKDEENHYEVSLPWKEDYLPSSNNYRLCETRLKTLHYKLKNEPNLLSDYHQIIKDQELKGVVERVDESNLSDQSLTKAHYSPHHAVVRKERETTKVRVVYDGSAKQSKDERSLNDCLEVGENYIPHVFDQIIKFRWNAIGLTGDIEKAFLQVGINPEDRDMLRFLWYEDPFSSNPEPVVYRFNRLVFGLRPSPSILGATIEHHLRLFEQSEPEIAELLKDSLYVDDLITGEENEAKAFNVYQKSKEIMAKGGFNLRKWHSNSANLLKLIKNDENPQEHSESSNPNEDDESYAKSQTTISSFNERNDTTVKVLGLNWDTATDEFFFELSELGRYGKSIPETKRSILSFTAKLFDPIGLLTPFTVELKIMFQQLCLTNTSWDGVLEEGVLRKWRLLLDELRFLNEVRIPRCYFQGKAIEIQIHGFSDASDRAYAAVLYLRSVYADGRILVRLVSSKSRVAPMKKQTIPRLELLGTLLLARLVNKVSSTFKQLGTINWSDSTTALCWIKNQRIWKQYVQHRVEEIRSLTTKDSWRHCPGELNPADIPSRGQSAKNLSVNSLWWNGPSFLQQPEEEWPKPQTVLKENDRVLCEVKKNVPEITHAMVNTSKDDPHTNVELIIDSTRYSSLTKLLRVTAFVMKFIAKLKNRVKSQEIRELILKELTALEINNAEIAWIKSVQLSTFETEMRYLTRRKTKDENLTIPKLVTQFGLYVDSQGIIRCVGRIGNSSLTSNAKHPILLPSTNHFVTLLIEHTHKNTALHNGIRDTLTALRERFWVIRGREAVKKVIRKCVVCLKHEGLPYGTHQPSDLPSTRVSDDPPFSHVGLDFAGPIYFDSKDKEANNERSSKKSYVCLFTCSSTRAVHLELCRSLNVPDFLLAFRRFSSRRGLPATLTSDNAQTFKASRKEILKIVRSDEVKLFLSTNRVTWSFIVERAPWWGGFWERLVKSIKRPLKKLLGRSTLSFEELRTILVEIETVINSRPITYVYDDVDSISYPLTPSNLIYGRRISSTPNSAQHEIISTYRSLTRRARHHRNLLSQLTEQWKREYLTSLREQSIAKQKPNNRAISAGDIVLLKKDCTARCMWKLAKVQELIPGADGKIRSAIVKVSRSDKRPIYLRRVVQHLIPIEVEANDEEKENDQLPVDDQSTPTVEGNVRPRRNAAVIGEIVRRERDL